MSDGIMSKAATMEIPISSNGDTGSLPEDDGLEQVCGRAGPPGVVFGAVWGAQGRAVLPQALCVGAAQSPWPHAPARNLGCPRSSLRSRTCSR